MEKRDELSSLVDTSAAYVVDGQKPDYRTAKNCSFLKLDLVLTTPPESVSTFCVFPGLNDHSAINFIRSWKPHRVPKGYNFIREYQKANFSAFNAELACFAEECFSDCWARFIGEKQVI